MSGGGWRLNSGRKKGSPNRRPRIRPADAKGLAELAQQYTPEATMTLVDIMRHSKSEHARISAAVHLMDRGHGKVPQGSFDPRKSPSQQDNAERVFETPEELRQELMRRDLPMRRLRSLFQALEREEDAAERENGQNCQSGQRPPGAEEQWESDAEDS
jgi:hypothetical protein